MYGLTKISPQTKHLHIFLIGRCTIVEGMVQSYAESGDPEKRAVVPITPTLLVSSVLPSVLNILSCELKT
jgi:hypothetical protein